MHGSATRQFLFRAWNWSILQERADRHVAHVNGACSRAVATGQNLVADLQEGPSMQGRVPVPACPPESPVGESSKDLNALLSWPDPSHILDGQCPAARSWLATTGKSIDLREVHAEVAERQTHQLEGLAVAIPWGFESTRPHHSYRFNS